MGFHKRGKIASSEKQQGRSCGVAMWMVAAVVFLCTAPEAVVSSSSSTPSKCHSCMNCTDMGNWQQATTAFLTLLGELSDGDNFANNSYMKDFDNFEDFEDRVKGSSSAASCAADMDEEEGTALTISGTNCMTMWFTIRSTSEPNDFLSCTILTGVEKFFEDADGNTTEDQLQTVINSLTQANIEQDMDSVSGYDVEGNVSICGNEDDCNFYPTGDEVTIREDLGAWSDDYDDETSTVYLAAEAFADGVCTQFKSGDGRQSAASDCEGEVKKSTDPDLNKRRRRRSSVTAVIVFSLTFPPATGLDDDAFEAMYSDAVTDAAAADPSGVGILVSTLNLGQNPTASVTVGGANPATTQAPSSAPSLKPFSSLLTFNLLVFGILASKRC